MKNLLILCLLWSWSLAAEVFFIPGWRTGFDRRTGCVRILHDIYPGQKITVKSWDSDQPWQESKLNARKHKEKLLAEIMAMPEEFRRELIIVGHSIGAQIATEILAELNYHGMCIHSAALLGASVADDSPDICSALKAVRYHCCIIYNPDDWVLKYLLAMDDREHIPLGLYGWAGGCSHRVFEARAESASWGFFNHYAYIYLEELDRLLDEIPEIAPRVDVLQDEKNKVRRPADAIFWTTESEFQGWKLQKSIFPEMSEKYRIIDPDGLRRAAGRKKQMTASFADVAEQLKTGMSAE